MNRVKWLWNLGTGSENYHSLNFSDRREGEVYRYIICIRIPWEWGLLTPSQTESVRTSGVSIWICSSGDNFHQSRLNLRSDLEVCCLWDPGDSQVSFKEQSSATGGTGHQYNTVTCGRQCHWAQTERWQLPLERDCSLRWTGSAWQEIIWNKAMQQDHLPDC